MAAVARAGLAIIAALAFDLGARGLGWATPALAILPLTVACSGQGARSSWIGLVAGLWRDVELGQPLGLWGATYAALAVGSAFLARELPLGRAGLPLFWAASLSAEVGFRAAEGVSVEWPWTVFLTGLLISPIVFRWRDALWSASEA